MNKSAIVDAIHKELDDYFDAGWKIFVEGIREQNRKSNERLYRVLAKIKGEDFAKDLAALNKIVSENALIQVIRKPIGMLFNDNRFKSIPEIWIYQKSSEGRMVGSVCVQVKTDRWIIMHY